MISSNIVLRTLRIRAGSRKGTAVVLPFQGQDFLVTAKHIFDGSRIDCFELFYNDSWRWVSGPLSMARYGLDLAAGKWPHNNYADLEIFLGAHGSNIMLGCDLYTLGFPLELATPSHEFRQPIPIVAKGTMAALGKLFDADDQVVMLMAAQLDEGYSGGPVIWASHINESPRILGIVAANLFKKTSAGREPVSLVHVVPSKEIEDFLSSIT